MDVEEEEGEDELLSKHREEEEEGHDHASEPPESRLILQIKRIVNRPRKKDSALRSMTTI